MKEHRTPTRTRPLGSLARRLIGLGIVILSTLGTLVACGPGAQYFDSERARAASEVVAICAALDEYSVQHDGRYPETLEALVLPDENGRTLLEDLTGIPPDPWGTPYAYEPALDGGAPFRVISFGRDGQPGGRGPDADLDNLTIGLHAR